MEKDKILIVGAGFNNSGAIAMSLVTVYELKKFLKFNDMIMMTATYRNNLTKNIKFSVEDEQIIFRWYMVERKNIGVLKSTIIYSIKNILKLILNKIMKKEFDEHHIYCFINYKKRIESAKAIFDISGFKLGSSWPSESYYHYTNLIKICSKYNIPLYLLPQSFGPFDFSDEQLSELKELLPTVRIIFAREKEGYDYLTKELKLKNVVLSTDLVLQNKEIDYKVLLKQIEKTNFECKVKDHNIAILPNVKVFERCDNVFLLELYKNIVDECLSLRKNVYILRHSKEDIVCAKMIKEMYPDNNKVVLVEEQFTSYQFEEVVQNFDYIIASRYHAIVHAYKHNIPSIAIGWAVKYVELLGRFSQSKYIFDVRDQIDSIKIIEAIDYMNNNFVQEKIVIADVLKEIQQNNCFDLVKIDLKNFL